MSEKDLSPSAKVARGATYVFMQGFASAALGVVYIVLLTRLLSTEEIGTFGVLTFALGMVQTFGLLALPSASTKYIAQFIAEGDREKAKAVVARVLQITIVVSFVAFVVVFVFSGWISTVLSSSSLVIQASVVQTLALASFSVVMFYQAMGFLQGLQRLREMAMTNLLYTVIQYGLALYLVYAGFGIFGIILSWTLALIISAAFALTLTGRNLGIFGKPHELKPLMRFSFPIYISSIFGFLIVWVDQLFILPFMGLAPFGMYNIANRAAVVPALISSAFLAALYPKLSQLYAESGKNSLESAFTVTTRYIVLVGFPMILLVAVLAYPIMILFAGAQYALAAFPLSLLCIASLFNTLGVSISPTFFTLEKTRIASVIAFVSVITDAVFSYILIAVLGWGMNGAATAKIIAAAVGLTMGIAFLRQFIRVKFDREMLWKVILACGVMIFAILGFDLLRQQVLGPPQSFLVFRLILLPVYIILGFAVYFFAIIALRSISEEDIGLFREYLPSKLKWTAGLVDRLIVLSKVSRNGFFEEIAAYVTLSLACAFGALVQSMWWLLPSVTFILVASVAALENRRNGK